MVTTVYAARAHFIGGAIHDLVFFRHEFDAHQYRHLLRPLPLGFERLEVVPIDVIGSTDRLPRKRRDTLRRAG